MATTSRTDSDLSELASRLRMAVVRTARRMRQEAGSDLSPTLIAALATIDRGGPITPSELAEVERVKRPTATRIAASLERDGLIERAADPTDGRAALLSVSPKGRELLRRVRRRKNAYLSRRLHQLDGEEIAALERAAEVLEHLLEEDSR